MYYLSKLKQIYILLSYRSKTDKLSPDMLNNSSPVYIMSMTLAQPACHVQTNQEEDSL